ncbi:hypothetical protein, variant [Verruconis gallopava]|nr:hypothetical protein, variant [Verruconis gallopava]KIW02787.1 hypothetical protein, variant [Verruconis gallopava]
MTVFFPFVQLPRGLTVATLVEERPFLLLAIASAAAFEYPQLQRTLEAELKEMLSLQVIINGNRSLDILQGLLVYLAWFHFHLVPRSRRTYTYIQLAISIVIDLGLHEENGDINIDQRDRYSSDPSSRPEGAELCSNEARRAYLGCYYLSINNAQVTSKPNNLPFSEKMLQDSILLDELQEYQTDRLIRPLIRLQHLAERTYETYRGEKSDGGQNRLHLHASQMITQLKEWKCSTPSDLADTALLQSAYHCVRIQIYEMGLVYRCPNSKIMDKNIANGAESRPVKPAVIANLVKSVEAAKEAYDFFLEIPPRSYNYLSTVEWSRITTITIIIYTLSVRFPGVPDWNRELARQTLEFEKYLGKLVDHINCGRAEMSSSASLTPTMFALFPDILDSVRVTYAAITASPSNFPQGIRAHKALDSGKECQRPSTRRARNFACPGFRHLPARWDHPNNSTFNHPQLSYDAVTELQAVENKALWDHLFSADYLT